MSGGGHVLQVLAAQDARADVELPIVVLGRDTPRVSVGGFPVGLPVTEQFQDVG